MEQTEAIPAVEEKTKSFGGVIKNAFKELKDTSIAFVKAPQALWGINVPYVLEGLVYFGILTELGIFSSENVGLIDSQASLVYSFVTGGITLFMLLLGGFSDKIGVRKSLIISFIVFLAGRILVSLSGTLGLSNGLWSPMFFTMISGLFVMVIAYGLYQPAAYAGVKRYTTPKTAAIAYGAIYGFMNLGAFLSGFVASLTRQNFETTFPPNGLTAVFWAFAIITFIALVLCLVLLTRKADADAVAKANAEKKTENEEQTAAPQKLKEKINNIPFIIYDILGFLFFLLSGVILDVPINVKLSTNLFGFHITFDLFFIIFLIFYGISIYEFLRKRPEHPIRKNFRLIIYALITLLLFLFSSFAFNIPINFVATVKIFGLNIKFDLLFILSIIFFVISVYEFLRNRPQHPFRDKRFSFFIFILIPVQTLFAHNWLTIPYYTKRAFPVGSVVETYYEVFSNINPILIFILAPVIAGLTSRANVYRMMILGTIVMAIPTFLLTAGPNIYLFLLYVFISTVGEAMWQPRFLQWIAEVAPKGMTGLYMGVGQFPWFLTKVITGFYSGWFLMHYCPDGIPPSEMNTGFMWFIYGLIAIVSPIGLIAAKNWMLKGFKEKSEA